MSLAMSGGNVKRASRDTGVPEQTVRNWKRNWEANGGIPAEVAEKVEGELAPAFMDTAISVRDQALQKIAEFIPHTEPKDLDKLIKIVGILDDKVRLAAGLATQRKEVTHTLPSPEELRELAKSFAIGAVEAAALRDEAIIDAEVVEQAEPLALEQPFLRD